MDIRWHESIRALIDASQLDHDTWAAKHGLPTRTVDNWLYSSRDPLLNTAWIVRCYSGHELDRLLSGDVNGQASPVPLMPHRLWSTMRKVMERDGWSMVRLARDSGICRRTLYKWEVDYSPRIRNAVAVASTLGVPLDALCRGSL